MNPRQVNPIVNFSLRKIEKHVATNALGMNTLTRAVVPVLKERCKSLPNFQSVIPTSVDLERFRLTPFPKGRIRMLISGNLNQNYDIQLLNELISAFKTQLNLEVVWASDVAASIQDPIYDLKVSVNHEEMPELIASCHFGVALLQKSGKESLAAAMPTKIAEFLAIGRPVIVSSEVGDFDQMLHDRRAGLTLSSNKDLIFIIQEMAQLLSDPKTSSMCRDLAEKYFSLATSATKYIDLYSKLMCNTDRESN
jgi:glycosyltransferase involved in cell wall biosynthesis